MFNQFIGNNNSIQADMYPVGTGLPSVKNLFADNNIIVPPMVYKIKEHVNPENNEISFGLEVYLNQFDEPKKIYGETKEDIARVLNRYKKKSKSVSMLATGRQGTGKTSMAEIIANHVMHNYKVPVILVTEITASIELIHFFSTLGECVLIFDEYGKYFNINMQEKSLNMLSSKTGPKKLIIVTENETNRLSSFILNRTGRFHYHFEFDKISERVIKEYFEDYNVTDEKFIRSVLKKYSETHFFSFDFLQGLTDEHLDYPEDSLDELMRVLNVKILIKPTMLYVDSVTSLDDQDIYRFDSSDVFDKKQFKRGRKFWIWLENTKDDIAKFKNPEPKAKRLTVGISSLVKQHTEDDVWELEFGECKVIVRAQERTNSGSPIDNTVNNTAT